MRMAENSSPCRSHLLSNLRSTVHLCYPPKCRRRRRRVGDPATSTGRLSSLQEIFAHEVADEERGSAKAEPASKREENAIWHSIWHRGTGPDSQLKFIWHISGTVMT